MKCQYCDYEETKGDFQYLYKVRVNDGSSWRKCPSRQGCAFMKKNLAAFKL